MPHKLAFSFRAVFILKLQLNFLDIVRILAINTVRAILFSSLDQLVYIADRVIAESDLDGDGVISFEEFRETLQKLDIENKMAMVGLK